MTDPEVAETAVSARRALPSDPPDDATAVSARRAADPPDDATAVSARRAADEATLAGPRRVPSAPAAPAGAEAAAVVAEMPRYPVRRAIALVSQVRPARSADRSPGPAAGRPDPARRVAGAIPDGAALDRARRRAGARRLAVIAAVAASVVVLSALALIALLPAL